MVNVVAANAAEELVGMEVVNLGSENLEGLDAEVVGMLSDVPKAAFFNRLTGVNFADDCAVLTFLASEVKFMAANMDDEVFIARLLEVFADGGFFRGGFDRVESGARVVVMNTLRNLQEGGDQKRRLLDMLPALQKRNDRDRAGREGMVN